jgi:hypothetical protein
MLNPLPHSLPFPTQLTVTDTRGRKLRADELPAGSDLPDRLRLAHRNYKLQGWTVEPLKPGASGFVVQKAGQRLSIAIRRVDSAPGDTAHGNDPAASKGTDIAPTEGYAAQTVV